MLSSPQQPPDPVPSLAGRLGKFFLVIGVVVGVAMAVAEPSMEGENPGPVLIGLGLVLLVIAWLGEQRQGPSRPEDKRLYPQNRP